MTPMEEYLTLDDPQLTFDLPGAMGHMEQLDEK